MDAARDTPVDSGPEQRSSEPAHDGAAAERTSAAGPSLVRSAGMVLQPKLTVGAADDPYEREADQVADRVVAALRTTSRPGAEEASARRSVAARVQRSAPIGAAGGTVDAETDRAISSSRGGGQTMPGPARERMESAFGADFSGIRLHQGSQSRALNDRIQAKAFSVGNDIFFRDGVPDTGSSEGQHLMAHELTHTIQQGAAPVSRVRRSASSVAESIGTDNEPRIRRLTYNQNPTTWGDPATINRRRSGEGALGVFFANDGGAVFAPGTVVVKPLMSSGEIDFANKFLSEGMGFEVPDSVTYSMESDEGQALSGILSAPGLVTDRDANEITDQLAMSNRIMVMSIVEGKSIQTLDEGGAVEFLRNAPALEQVGRLMVSDAFLGNGDRLVGSGPVNLGNFFYAAATAASAGRVTTIDNDSNSGRATRGRSGGLNGPLQSKVFFIEQLCTAQGQDLFINKFLAKMRQSHVAHQLVIDELDNQTPRITGDIRGGITQGLADIVDVFTNNMDLVRSMTDLSDEAGAGKLQVDEAKGAAHYTKARVGGVDPDTAATQLSSYMTYRHQRSRFKTGFKWMTKLGMNRGFTDD